MTDVFSKEKRSEVMSKIRGKNNKDTELAFISFLQKHKIRGWRRNQTLFGKPDFVFYRARVVIFIDGCFWHSCPAHFTRPKSNQEFWDKKIKSNLDRDAKVNSQLIEKGWNVLRIWEHDLTNHKLLLDKLAKPKIVPGYNDKKLLNA